MNTSDKRYLLICNTSDGLIAQVNGVVVQLQLARRLGLEPIVYLHRRSYMFGGPNPYFDETHGPNVWEYFFEPIGPSPSELTGLVKDGKVFTVAAASELIRLFRWQPKSWFMNPYGYYRSVENEADGAYPAAWWLDQRNKARALLDDGTVRIKESLRHQVDRFVAENFTQDTLGLQLRGSDKFDFGVGANLSRKVLPEEYVSHIDEYLATHPDGTRIFVATDQRQWLKVLEQAYPGKILSFSEKSLSDSNENRFHDAQEKAARGVEVLVDMLLLSHCNYIVKCHAAVGEMALVLNPALDFRDLNYIGQPYQAKNTALRPLAAPVIAALSGLWNNLAENRSALSKVTEIDGDTIVVDGGRPLNIKQSNKEKAPRAPLLSRQFISDGLDWGLRSLSNHCFTYVPRDTDETAP